MGNCFRAFSLQMREIAAAAAAFAIRGKEKMVRALDEIIQGLFS